MSSEVRRLGFVPDDPDLTWMDSEGWRLETESFDFPSLGWRDTGKKFTTWEAAMAEGWRQFDGMAGRFRIIGSRIITCDPCISDVLNWVVNDAKV